MMMSYMGSVGTLMKGSGLEEALATCSGKAVSRALCGHLLASSSLQIKFLTPSFP